MITYASLVSFADNESILHFSDSDDEPAKLPNIPTQALPSNRKHQRSNSDMADAPSTASSAKRPALFQAVASQNCGPIGISRAARGDQAAKDALADGTFKLTMAERNSLLRRARIHDSNARLDPEDPTGRRIWHSLCKSFVWLDAPKRTSKFTRHVKMCMANGGQRKNSKSAKAAAQTHKIDTLFEKFSKQTAPNLPSTLSHSQLSIPSPSPSPTPPPMVSCCGLREAHDSRLTTLMDRGPIGGRKSLQKIAKERYNKDFKDLDTRKKMLVRTASTATASWIVHSQPQPHVRSIECLQECDPSTSELVPTDICGKCAGLLDMREFRNALARKPASEANLKYVPHINRNKYAAMLYGRFVGLKEIIEHSVSGFLYTYIHPVLKICFETDIYSFAAHEPSYQDAQGRPQEC
jgi:hypothetical protein